MDYCNSSLFNLPLTRLKPLIAQKNSSNLCEANNHISITALMRDLPWPPIEKRIKCKICTLIQAAYHHGTPSYLSDLIKQIHQTRSLRDCHIHKLTATIAQNNNRSFIHYGIKIWNDLPFDLREISSMNVVANALTRKCNYQEYVIKDLL